MPIDTSIYQNIRPVEMPSMLESKQKAATLSSLAMQQMGAAKQMQRESKDAAYNDHVRKTSIIGNALESLSGLKPEQRAAAYPSVMSELVKAGVVNEGDAPAEYDEGLYTQSLLQFRQSKEGLDKESTRADIAAKKAEAAKDYAMSRAKGVVDPVTGQMIYGKKMLPPDKVLSVNEGNAIPSMLDDVKVTLDANKDEFGPISGRAASWNPWNTKAKTIDAQMRAASQAFGRKMEGGVLRKEDEEKYRKMFPNLSDTAETAANKLVIVQRLLAQKQASDVKALDDAGYSTAGLDKKIPVPNAPKILGGDGLPGIGSAVAGDSKQMVKKQYSPSRNQTKIVYADGTEELLNGKQ